MASASVAGGKPASGNTPSGNTVHSKPASGKLPSGVQNAGSGVQNFDSGVQNIGVPNRGGASGGKNLAAGAAQTAPAGSADKPGEANSGVRSAPKPDAPQALAGAVAQLAATKESAAEPAHPTVRKKGHHKKRRKGKPAWFWWAVGGGPIAAVVLLAVALKVWL